MELTKCSREAVDPAVLTGFVSLRHQDIDPAAPCLPASWATGWLELLRLLEAFTHSELA